MIKGIISFMKRVTGFLFCFRAYWKETFPRDVKVGVSGGTGAHLWGGLLPVWRRSPEGQRDWNLPRLLAGGAGLQRLLPQIVLRPLGVCEERGTVLTADPDGGPQGGFLPSAVPAPLLDHREPPGFRPAAARPRQSLRERVAPHLPQSQTLRQLLWSL